MESGAVFCHTLEYQEHMYKYEYKATLKFQLRGPSLRFTIRTGAFLGGQVDLSMSCTLISGEIAGSIVALFAGVSDTITSLPFI